MASESEQVLKKVFDSADANGNGTIEAKELVNLIRAAGHTITRVEAEALIKENENGTLEFGEFVNMMNSFLSKGGHRPSPRRRRIFQLLDQNKDARDLPAGAPGCLHERHPEGGPLRTSSCSRMLNEADTDKDGAISFDEIQHTHGCQDEDLPCLSNY
uniref:Calmodulin n=1 Tax=Macrostomum lignano TaxID=282301 RepID=A0A1I8F8Y3_9PLAT